MTRMTSVSCVLFLMAFAAFAQNEEPSITFEGLMETNVVYPGDVTRLAVRVQLAKGWHMNAHKPLESFLIPTVMTLTPPAGLTIGAIIYPEPEQVTLSFADGPMAVYSNDFAMTAVLSVEHDVAPGSYEIQGDLRFQPCNDVLCGRPRTAPFTVTVTVADSSTEKVPANEALFAKIMSDMTPPEPEEKEPTKTPEPDAVAAMSGDWKALAKRFDIVGRQYGYMKSEAFLTFLDNAEAGKPQPVNPLVNQGALMLVLLVVGGGLLLNLTPCVLPLIPINIGIIGAGAQAGTRSRGFALGATYGLGITLAYGILGLIAILSSATFGTLNASPWFNFLIAIIFLVLALAMFEKFIRIDFSRFQSKLGPKKSEHGAFALALFMGAVSALLAGACVAPMLIATILFARDMYTNGNAFGLVLPFLLGLGMALPWPFAGAGLSFLPKPGAWMVRVRQGFGVLLVLFSLYYAYEGIILLADRPGDVEEDGWYHDLPKALETGLREDKLVVIDFWASWCKNCRLMDRTTFQDETVKERLNDFVAVKYRADFPDESPYREVLDHFEVPGMPTYLVLAPREGP